MSINFYNLKEQYDDQRFEIMTAIHEVAVDGQFFANSAVSKFESLVSSLYNKASCVATNSGTSALVVALKAANLPLNSIVAVPAMTYVATANAVVAAGHCPICIDIDDTWLMNYDHLERYLVTYKDKIKAVVLVDLYGQGADLQKFKKLTDYFNVKLIIDAAQSFELLYDKYHQIDYCDSLALSFNPLKNLGALGNAGAVLSKNYTVDQLKKWTVQGKESNGDVVESGFNCRIDAIQAAVLNVKYQKFDDNMRKKTEISWYYRHALENYVEMPARNYLCTHTNYVFEIAPSNADTVRSALSEAGIEFASHYIKPIHHLSAFPYYKDHCPKASSLAGRCISLPNHWHLTANQVETVIQVVKLSLA